MVAIGVYARMMKHAGKQSSNTAASHCFIALKPERYFPT